jgi:type I restriction enzyme S subunit
VSRPVDLSAHEELVRLGLYNRGRGVFKKPAADEEGMGASNFHFIKSGDLIISGQFAWEGAVAMASEVEEGCVVSHRYPVYRAVKGVNTGYLLGFLRSSLGNFILNDCSRGSAGRNRPLNAWRLGKEKIPVPDTKLQEKVERAVVAHRKIKDKTEASIRKLNEFRIALINEAVTGQIDVNECSRRGHSDVKLDAIAKEMKA